ncbi:MAG: acrylyl-CoA reductase family protein [Acidimicrobiales bacterium]
MAQAPSPVSPGGSVDGPFDAYVVRADGDERHGSVEQLEPSDLPAGEVLVAVQWSTVNYKDGMVAQPGNRVARTFPLVPGVDLAGVVVESEATEVLVGTSVLAHGHDIGVSRHGGFARFARLPADWIVPLPEGLSARDAMAIGTAGFTAALSVDELERHGLRPGLGPVVVTGASGGVGSMSVTMLARRGYEVTASTGRIEERDWLEQLGATAVVGRDDIDDAPGRVLGSERWAGAVDCVGGATLARILRSLRYGAAVAASGLTGGVGLETTVYPFITRQVALLGIDSVQTPGQRRREVWARLADDLRPRDLEAMVEEEVPLGDLGTVLARIVEGKIRGRVLVRVAPDAG